MPRATVALLVLAASSPLAFGQRRLPTPAADTVRFDQGGRPTFSKALSWRAGDQKLHFVYSAVPRGKKFSADVQIWAFGDAGQTPHPAGQNLVLPGKPGKIAWTQTLGEVGVGDTQFAVDFANFAPRVSPISAISGGGSGGGIAGASIAEVRKQAREAAVATGSVTYVLQVVTSDGGASRVATVEFGEINLAKGTTPLLEYLYSAGTPEFPEQKWGADGTLDGATGASALTFRWQPPRGTTLATVQVMKKEEETPWTQWTFTKTVQKQTLPVTSTGVQTFALDLSALKKAADGSKYLVRVVPQADPVTLASLPSSTVVFTVANAPAKANPATLKFTYEMAGWSPGYEGAYDDAYRFVVAAPSLADTADIRKILGGSPTLGAKVYLPPVPPPKEKAWYEKVVDAIKAVVSFIDQERGMIGGLVSQLEDAVVKVPGGLAKAVGVPASVADGAYRAYTSSMNFASDPLHASERIKAGQDYIANGILDEAGITDPSARLLARGKVIASLSKWAGTYRWTETSGKIFGLAPDPDYVVHTGVAYVRVTAHATGALPAGFRMKGPSVTFEAGTMAQNQELLGTKPEYYPLYTGSLAMPTMADGESIVVPIVTRYTSVKTSRPADWKFGYTYVVHSKYWVNSKLSGATGSIHEAWGTVPH